jgi:hypothetical protein
VLLGILEGAGARLIGGGFETLPMTGYPGEPGAPIIEAVTSTHTVEGLGGSSGVGTAWGSLGPAGQGPGVSGTLECTSCHNPHGSKNYRILRDLDNGYPYGAANAYKHRWVPENPYLKDWQDYQVLPTDNLVGGPDQYATGDNGNYTSGMSFFCSTCHTEYLTPSGHNTGPDGKPYPGTAERGSPNYNAGDGKGAVPRFRHAIVRSYSEPKPLRFAALASLSVDNDGDTAWDPPEPCVDVDFDGCEAGEFTDWDGDTVWDSGDKFDETTAVSLTTRTGFTCLSCHFAHGSAAEAEGDAANVAPTNDSALLYYDNRGVCRQCHQTNK